jgi:RNA polymerase sigma-70 factor (ECF subfamily)
MDNAAVQSMEQALARSAKGEAAAFEEIMRRHQSMVYSLCYHFLHDSCNAEEAAQDVFVRLYRNIGSIGSAAHLVRWLRKVAYHRCIDEARKMPALPPIVLENLEACPADERSADPWLSQRLRRMVASLPEDSRMVVILRFQEDLDLAEVAEILEIPLNTVKSRLQRSLDILREKLGRYAGEVRK